MMKRRRWLLNLSLILTLILAPASLVADEDQGESGESTVSAERPVMDGLTGGDTAWEEAFDGAMLEGRQAYNSEDWPGAERAFIRAIQVLPDRPAPYRNLARTYNFMGDFRSATEYYDRYLRMAPDADDVEAIRLERRGTVARSGDDPWRLPGDQRLSLRALDRELDEGRGLSGGGGGAYGLFQSLLDMNFADQEIGRLRQRLERKISTEFEEALAVDDGFLPVLTAEQWALQAQRLDALSELTRSEGRLEDIEGRRLVVDAATALFGGHYERAVQLSDQAMEQNPGLLYVGWYGVIALVEMDHLDRALSRLDALVEAGAFAEPGRRRAAVVRAQLLRRLGDHDQAAQSLGEALSK